MTDYHIVFDGSYNYSDNTIGIGLVIIHGTDPIKKIRKAITDTEYGGHASLMAEALAAREGLSLTEEGSTVFMYGDYDTVIKILNDGRLTEGTHEAANLLTPYLQDRLVTALNWREIDNTIIPNMLFNMAHNLSAEASGSSKRQNGETCTKKFNPTTINPKKYPLTDGMEIIPIDDRKGKNYPPDDPRHPDFKF